MTPAPLRIASLLSSATEMLCGLGLQQSLVAISHECDYPASILSLPRATHTRIDPTQSSQQIDDCVRAALAAGEPLYDVDAGLLDRLQPDLIVTQAQCDVCAVRLADVEAVVASMPRARQPRIVSLNPASLNDVLREIELLGEAAGASRAAHDYLASLRARIERVRSTTAGIVGANRPRRVALIEWIEPLMLSGNWLPELVQLAGGEHALTTAGEHSPHVAWADVVRYDPEVVIVAPCGFSLERTLEELPLLAELPGWQNVSASRTRQVYALDGNAYLNRSGPRLVDSLEILAHLIYAGQIGVPECVAKPRRVWRQWE
jgi:iron complex transport system substrate-binding protein